jgi:GNAT superfamily N-acetyltransferase
MTGPDSRAVAAIAHVVHPGFPEDEAIVAERLALAPDGCRVLEGPNGPLGYAVSHPWREGQPPSLNTLLGRLPAQPDTWYIHDVALMPAARGTGAAAAIVAALIGLASAARLRSLSLVAVNASAGFWSRHGFSAIEAPDLTEKLRSYGPDARYMLRRC